MQTILDLFLCIFDCFFVLLPLQPPDSLFFLPFYMIQTRAAYVLFYCCSDKDQFALKRLPSQSPAKKVRRQKNQMTSEGEEKTEPKDMAREKGEVW